MTAYCPAIGSYWRGTLHAGVGSEAVCIQHRAEESLKDYLEPRLVQIVPDIRHAVSESQAAAVPVDQDTLEAAIAFASLLPRSLPIPEVSADPDGEISFDWIGPSRKMFSVSVNKAGRLAYAGWFAENSTIHGTENFSDSLPQEIVRSLSRATR